MTVNIKSDSHSSTHTTGFVHQEYDLAALYNIRDRVRSPSTTAVDQWMNLVVIDYTNGNVGHLSRVH
jgi:hypothetical protein